MIRHAGRGRPLTAPVGSLPVAMIQPAFLAVLVPLVGASPLAGTGQLTARFAAVAMTAIAMRTDEKDGMTTLPDTGSLPQFPFAMSRRHCCPAGLDNGSLVVSG